MKKILLAAMLIIFVSCGGDNLDFEIIGYVDIVIPAPMPVFEIEEEQEHEEEEDAEEEPEEESEPEIQPEPEPEPEPEIIPADQAMKALGQIESGAFDMEVNLQITTTDIDLGDVMGGFFQGIDLNIGMYSRVVGGEVLDARFVVSGMELTPETLNTFGLDDMFTAGGFNIEELMLDMLRQIIGNGAELDFALAMLPVDTQGVEMGEVRVFVHMDDDYSPALAMIDLSWEMPVGGEITQFFADIRIYFNAVGDTVTIELGE